MIERMETIDNNLNTIKKKSGNYSIDDYENIIDNLENSYTSIKSEPVFDYVINKTDVKYTVNDIFTFFGNDDIFMTQLDTEKILKKYSDNSLTSEYRNVMIDNFFTAMHSADFLRTYTSYQYNSNPFVNENEFYSIDNMEIRGAVYKLHGDLSQLAYLTELVIEVGDIHE